MKHKGLAVMTTAAVMTIASAIGTWAAQGWAQSGNTWVYYDNYGNKETHTWKKGADNLWRYLNGSGEMAINQWVDNTYYVDANGIMVIGKWVQFSSNGETCWSYFDNNGKAANDKWKKIDNKWYYFDTNGIMQTGWVDDDTYYCGSNGVMVTGWQNLYPSDVENEDEISPNSDSSDNDEKKWYYFLSNGKKYTPDQEYGLKKIDGTYYCFDQDGAIQKGWVNVGSKADDMAPIADYRYCGDDGKVKTGWLSVEPPEDIQSNYNYDVEWFYFSNTGVPKTGPDEGEARTSDLIKIKNITYLFNKNGNPVHGLQKVYTGSDEYTSYYFGDRQTSSVVKGTKKIEEGDGNIWEYYFQDSGKGYTGVHDSSLYYKGKLQKAFDGNKYSVITIENGKSHTNYVVNASGRVPKNTTVKDGDGVKLKVGSNGVLLQVDGEAVGDSTFESPVEPVYMSDSN